MSITKSLSQAGRVVAYYPKMAKFFGSVNSAILFSQFLYWQDKTDNPMGVYKSSEELEEETGLSYREQQTARKKLVENGYLIETNKRLEHRIYFLLNTEKIDADFDAFANQQNVNPPNDKSALREETNAQSVNIDTRLHTLDYIHNSKPQAVAKKPVQKNQSSVEKPTSVDNQVWNDFLQHRKAKRATVTQTALNAIEREAQKANISLQTALEEVILRGWQGFKAEWYLKDQQSTAKPAPNANRAITKNADIHARNKAVADEFIRKMREEEALKLNNGDLIDG